MKRQWYEVNLNRLLNILMSRKRVNEKQLNQETVLEKERLAYEAAKKQSLAAVLESIGEELAAVRLRIYPLEIPDVQRNDMIQASVGSIMTSADSYEKIDAEINEILGETDDYQNVDYAEFLHRGGQRRKNVNKSLGGNTERAYWYDVIREEQQISDCNWGFEIYADLLHTADIGSRPPSDINLLGRNVDEGGGDEADYEEDGD